MSEIEKLLHAISEFVNISTYASANGNCAWCSSGFSSGHKKDCPYDIARNDLIKLQHEVAKLEKLGMYKDEP